MDLSVSSGIRGRSWISARACRASSKSSNSELVASLFAAALVRVRLCGSHLLGTSVIRSAEVRRSSACFGCFPLHEPVYGRAAGQRSEAGCPLKRQRSIWLRSVHFAWVCPWVLGRVRDGALATRSHQAIHYWGRAVGAFCTSQASLRSFGCSNWRLNSPKIIP